MTLAYARRIVYTRRIAANLFTVITLLLHYAKAYRHLHSHSCLPPAAAMAAVSQHPSKDDIHHLNLEDEIIDTTGKDAMNLKELEHGLDRTPSPR